MKIFPPGTLLIALKNQTAKFNNQVKITDLTISIEFGPSYVMVGKFSDEAEIRFYLIEINKPKNF